jgi:hypothetical protein
MEKLQYPIGKYQKIERMTDDEFKQAIEVLKALPQWLDIIIQNKEESDFLKTYRLNGWTATQVIHHVADSHLNCLCRLKIALTEDRPTIRPYEEDKWALCADYNLPVNNSVTLLHTIHHKLVSVFSSLTLDQRQRTYYHPGSEEWFTIDGLLGLYAWHSQHHFEHLRIAFGLIG